MSRNLAKVERADSRQAGDENPCPLTSPHPDSVSSPANRDTQQSFVLTSNYLYLLLREGMMVRQVTSSEEPLRGLAMRVGQFGGHKTK